MSTLSQYAFTGEVFTATTTDPNVTAGTLTKHAGLYDLISDSNGYASDPEAMATPPDDATNIAQAITKNSYVYFQLDAKAGYVLNLSSITFNAARSGASTPRGYGVLTSVDSYAASIGNADLATQRTTWTAVNISLTGAAFQGLSTITFRIYVYGPYQGTYVDLDDITISGVAATTGIAIPVILNQFRQRRS